MSSDSIVEIKNQKQTVRKSKTQMKQLRSFGHQNKISDQEVN